MHRAALILLLAVLAVAPPAPGQRLATPGRSRREEDDDALAVDDEEDDANVTDRGMFVGAPCDDTCNPRLAHVFCNQMTGLCECEKKYPVRLNPYTGCSKPSKLGEQCYYKESCAFADQFASCVQIHHNAICQCRSGYHSVSIQKPSKRVFCAADAAVMTTNFSTFAGVLSGIALLSGLICFVLKLFNQNLYTGRHRYGNANLPPPILFSSEAGLLPMALVDRQMTSSISSQRTFGSTSAHSRRASSAPVCRPAGAAASRAGSRRPSVASVHSSNSIRSYSMRRYEKEREQKEEREMQKRLARMQSLTNSTARIPPTPSPHSTDDLLPTLEEDKPVAFDPIVPLAISEESSNSFQEDVPSTSKQYP